MCYIVDMGNQGAGRLAFFGGDAPPDREGKEGMLMNVTYGDLFQFCIFIVALVGLCYTIFRGRK